MTEAVMACTSQQLGQIESEFFIKPRDATLETMSPIIPGLVSTIIPVYNRAAFLREAVQSVLEQTYRPIEIIIVDDESTDDTPLCIAELVNLHPALIRAARQKNGGPGSARETGRKMARGEFIQYLDSDDILLPEKFEKQIASLNTKRQAGVSYCKTYEIELGQPLCGQPSVRTGEFFDELFPHLLNGRIWQTSTPLFRRSLTDRVGPWTNQRQEEDWEYDSRIAVLGTKLVWVDIFLCAHRHHGGERAGGDSLGSPVKMRWRFQTQKLLLERAIEYGVQPNCPSMAAFSRSLFLLCRQCGEAGLASESKSLFLLALRAADPQRSPGFDFKVYRILAKILGWNRLGSLACRIDRLRRNPK